MWMNSDYDALMTFADYTEEYGTEDLYSGIDIDQATQSAILDWFYYRKVVDNDRFSRFFNRALSKYINQYRNYIRVETTVIDPLVGNYLERQIIRSGTASQSGTQTDTGGSTRTGSTTSSGSSGGTVNTTTGGSTTGESTTETSTTDSNSTSGTSNTGTRHKHGETPQSYLGPGTDEMQLDWSYLSSQDQDATDNTTSGTSSGTSTANTTVNDQSTTTGTSQTTTTGTNSGETETSETTSNNGTHISSRNDTSNEDTKERLSGRQEAPQDMLKRARDYIITTNAFEWLCDKLDTCFMEILEV